MGVTNKEYKQMAKDSKRAKEAEERLKGNEGWNLPAEERIRILKERLEQLKKGKADEEKEEPKKRGRPKKVENKEPINIMKGRADLIGNRVEVETKVKKGLKNNEKKALKHAVIEDLDKKIKMTGRSINRIYLSDTESDSEKEEELKKVYKHLKSHMKDKKEKKDPRDAKQAKEIKKILSRK